MAVAAVARAAVAAKVKAKMAEVEVKAEAKEDSKVAVAEAGAEAARSGRRTCRFVRQSAYATATENQEDDGVGIRMYKHSCPLGKCGPVSQ